MYTDTLYIFVLWYYQIILALPNHFRTTTANPTKHIFEAMEKYRDVPRPVGNPNLHSLLWAPAASHWEHQARRECFIFNEIPYTNHTNPPQKTYRRITPWIWISWSVGMLGIWFNFLWTIANLYEFTITLACWKLGKSHSFKHHMSGDSGSASGRKLNFSINSCQAVRSKTRSKSGECLN